jgi:polysaccharide biosynthesis protein PslG
MTLKAASVCVWVRLGHPQGTKRVRPPCRRPLPARPRRHAQFLIITFLLFLAAPLLGARGIPLYPSVPGSLGVNIHFTSPRPGEIKEMAAAGIRWIRMDFFWSATERTKGHYDFSAYDRLLGALRPYHIRAIFILDYGNKLYDRGLAPYTHEGRQAFARWAVAAARHLQGQGVIWEMWNEPNWRTWTPKRNDRDYILLALAVGKALREGAPGATYIGPAGAVVDFPFLTECFRAGLLNYWQAVSVHPYRQRIPESVVPVYAQLRALIAQYAPKGRKIPIISGEWGYPSIPSWWGMTERLQAVMLAREWLTNLSNGIPISIWYDWQDDGSDPKNYLLHFGLAHFDYHPDRREVFEPKPAYWAARTLTRMLAGTQFRKQVIAGDSSDYLLLFTGPQRWRLVVWTIDTTPHQVSIPHVRGVFSAWNFEGIREPALRPQNGTLSVQLTDAPQYLIEHVENSHR